MKQAFPIERSITEDELCAAIRATPCTVAPPFADELISLGDLISQKLFQEKLTSDSPDLSSLAFFLRAASLKALRGDLHDAMPKNCRPMPRGRVLHIAPANVEVMFVYSWVISMLCGNSNIVRIPSKPSQSIEALCRCTRDALSCFPHVAKSQVGVSYEANSVVTRNLSDLADVRVIWGGDDTVAHIRSLSSRASLRDITFPNRFSWAAIKAAFFLALSDGGRDELVTRFFNDSFTFDQLACSSPHIILFVGESALCEEARADFMLRLQQVVSKREYSADASLMMQKLTSAALIASRQREARLERLSPEVMSLVTTFSEELRESPCGGGFFVVVFADSLEAIADMANYRDQTLSHAGFEMAEVAATLNTICGRGFDRIVPIGEALHFEPIWDGMNLLLEFTRTVKCVA